MPNTPQKKKTPTKTIPKKNSQPKAPKEKEPVAESPHKGQYKTAIRYAVGFFAAFLFLTFFPFVDVGFFAQIREVLKGMLGFGYYIAPFFLMYMVIRWDDSATEGVNAAKVMLSILDYVFLLMVVHFFAVYMSSPEDYGEAVKNVSGLYASGQNMSSAGMVGGMICAMMCRFIGWIPAMLLAFAGVFVCTVLLVGSSPMATIRKLKGFFMNILADKEEELPPPEHTPKKKPAAIPREETAEESADKKRKVPTVLVDDRAITEEDSLPVAEDKGGQHRFILPEEEQEEVFSRVPIELFRKDTAPRTVAAPDLAKTPELDVPVAAEEADETLPVAEEPIAPVAEEPPVAEENSPAEEAPTEDAPVLETAPETVEVVAETPPPYIFPPISLLTPGEGDAPKPTASDVSAISRKLESVLESFKVKAHVIGASFGPTVTQYEVQPETGVRVKQIANLSDDIALHLAAPSVRIENIPGKSAIGIEIPNRNSSTVRLRRLIENKTFRDHKSKLVTALGEDVSGNPVYLDIAKMPHLMIAGATGMGKSVCMNSLIVSLLYHASPEDVKFIMIDPKKVEMADYNGIPHLLVPVITDAKKAAGTLNWACVKMEERYNLIQEVAAKNLVEYNMIVKDDPEREQQPYIVIFIDELADLMMTAPDDVETSICRLAQKARAAGIHLVIGTQRPSVDVITGLIKANIPSRIAFTVASQVDSRTILDQTGAEKLLGRGDMLYYPVGAMKPTRVQGALVDGKSEVVAITQFIKDAATACYDEEAIEQIEKAAKLCGMPKGRRSESEGDGEEIKLDEKFLDALELAIDTKNISTSMVQTRLGLGYARAARIVGVMEQKGYIGAYDSTTKARQILITREELLEMKMKQADEANEG